MKFNIIFLMTIFTFHSVFAQIENQNKYSDEKNIIVEVFASGRFVSHAGYENGVYEYEWSKKSVYLPSIYTNYTTKDLYDSAYEYFYKKITISEDSFKNLINSSSFNISKVPFYYPDRLIMLFHKDSALTDTLVINDCRLVKFDNIVYDMNDNLFLFLLSNLPTSLKDNWSLSSRQAEKHISKFNINKR